MLYECSTCHFDNPLDRGDCMNAIPCDARIDDVNMILGAKPLQIYLDYDSTLNNLNDMWLHWVEHKYGIHIDPIEISSWKYLSQILGDGIEDFFKNEKIYSDLLITPNDGAEAFVYNCCRLFGAENVFILTHSWEGTEEAKNFNIRTFFKSILPSNIIHSGDKYKHTYNGVLIDDNPAHVVSHIQENMCTGIVFNRNNQYGWSSNPESVNSLVGIERHLLRYYYDYSSILTYLKKVMKVVD